MSTDPIYAVMRNQITRSSHNMNAEGQVHRVADIGHSTNSN